MSVSAAQPPSCCRLRCTCHPPRVPFHVLPTCPGVGGRDAASFPPSFPFPSSFCAHESRPLSGDQNAGGGSGSPLNTSSREALLTLRVWDTRPCVGLGGRAPLQSEVLERGFPRARLLAQPPFSAQKCPPHLRSSRPAGRRELPWAGSFAVGMVLIQNKSQRGNLDISGPGTLSPVASERTDDLSV